MLGFRWAAPASLGVATFSVFSILVACSSDGNEDAPATAGNGVNDVSAACAIRAEWTKPTSTACIECTSQAPLQACECPEIKDWTGKCNPQNQARQAEPTCQGVANCVIACDRTDCACVDACYVGKDACREKASAVDGCVAEVCAEICR